MCVCVSLCVYVCVKSITTVHAYIFFYANTTKYSHHCNGRDTKHEPKGQNYT